MSKRLNFSVIVCAHNAAGNIREAVQSLRKLDYPRDSYEVIVVDDASTDDTAKIVRRFKWVKTVLLETNVGVGGARNAGLRAAKGKWVAFMDDDCVADKNWLRELEQELKKPHTMGAGGLIAPKSIKYLSQRYLFRSGYGRPASVAAGAAKSAFGRLAAYAKDKFVHASGATEPGEAYEVYGANSAFSKQKLKAIKGFNIELRSAEDSDVCRRLQEKYPDDAIRFNPAAGIRHEYTSSFRAFLAKLFKRQGDTWDYYRGQHKTPPLYPFPIVWLLPAAVAGLVFGWLGGVITAVAMPLVLYGWWTAYAVRHGEAELLIYPFIQLLEEWVRVTGLLHAGFHRLGSSPKLAAAKLPQSPRKATLKKQAVPAPQRYRLHLSKKILLRILSIWGLLFIITEVGDIPWRGIVAVPFLAIVPGALLLLALQARVSALRGAVYALCGSLALLLGGGLIANTAVLLTHGRLHFDTPLLTLVMGLVCAVLAYAAVRRTPHDTAITLSFGRLRSLGYCWLALPLPLMAAIASAYLNKTGNNDLSMGALVAVVAIAAGMVCWYKKLSPARIGVLLFALGLTIMVLGSTRGDFVPGLDIAREYYVYQLTVHAGHWMPSLLHDAYNACLSITVLPFTLSRLLGINDMLMLRVVFPAIYALTPVAIYALSRRVANRVTALFAALFFMAQPAFVSWSSIPFRQMVAILFFAVMLLVVFDKHLSKLARNSLFLLFGLSMVLSHYSTSYLALGLLAIAYLLQLVFHLWQHKQWPWKLHGFRAAIGWPVLLVLIAGAAVWYGPVTHTSGNITHEISTGWHDLTHGNHSPLDIFSSNGHANKTSFADQFTIAPQSPDPTTAWNDYLRQTTTKYGGLHIIPLQQKQQAPAIKPQAVPVLSRKASPILVNLVNLLDTAVRKLVRLFLLVGLLALVWKALRRRATAFDAFALSAAAVLALVILVPHASIDYDVGRTSQQLLVLLALPTVSGGLLLARWILRSERLRQLQYVLVGLSFALLLLMVSAVPAQLTGGDPQTMLLNNNGNQYNQLYVHASEIDAGNWLSANQNSKNYVSAGYFGGNKLLLSGLQRPTTYDDVLPWTIDQHTYLFSSYAETTAGLATTYFDGQYVNYPYPTQIVTKAKNTIYTNGQTKVYK